MALKTTSAYLLVTFDCDALKDTFKCVTIKRACFRWCGMIQYSALVNSVFLIINVILFRFKLDISLYIPHVMAWRFHFPIRKFDFKGRCYSEYYFAHFSTHLFYYIFIMISVKKYGEKQQFFSLFVSMEIWRPSWILWHSPIYI